jgi:hypothetical protein
MWFGKSKTAPPELREKILASRPIRRADAKLDETGECTARLTIPIVPRRGFFFRVPEGVTKTFELDALGLFVWNCCDGQTSVEQIIQQLAQNFQLDPRGAEASTLQFLNLLASRSLVARKSDGG